jgi:hypothetical protein
MTTIATTPIPAICPISPIAYAGQLADGALHQLADAKTLLVGPQPLGDGSIELPPYSNNTLAVRSANQAVVLIDRAISFGAGNLLPKDVLDAFGRAKEQASAGVLQLTAQTLRAVSPADVALQFDAASMWLGVAKNLLGFTTPRNPIDPIGMPKPVLLHPTR